jgi:CRP-like cAMP-binding protein
MQVSSAFVADPELVEELEKRATPVAVSAGEVLFHQGDPPSGVYILSKGSAKLTSVTDGDPMLTVRTGAGSLLGVPAVVGTKPYTLTAEALEGAEVSVLSCEDFVRLMHTEPALSFRVLQVLAAEVRFARESLAARL